MKIVRFAPSPTGMLHIGGARTALFNWLYAKHTNGKFYLRIEDTDKERSTKENVDIILNDLNWLGLQWDGDIVYQSMRIHRHVEVANALMANGNAYRDDSNIDCIGSAIRLAASSANSHTVTDLIKGQVTFNKKLDDMVLLRSDGTPTYMLAVVVDDHDMGVTTIIRGDDHLNNTFRQNQIYDAMGWARPQYAHIPLIHGPDGKKLSKRTGSVGIDHYRAQGYSPEALRNYLLRLGWACKNEEFIPTEKAIELFSLEGCGKSAARFDQKKLDWLQRKHNAFNKIAS